MRPEPGRLNSRRGARRKPFATTSHQHAGLRRARDGPRPRRRWRDRPSRMTSTGSSRPSGDGERDRGAGSNGYSHPALLIPPVGLRQSGARDRGSPASRCPASAAPGSPVQAGWKNSLALSAVRMVVWPASRAAASVSMSTPRPIVAGTRMHRRRPAHRPADGARQLRAREDLGVAGVVDLPHGRPRSRCRRRRAPPPDRRRGRRRAPGVPSPNTGATPKAGQPEDLEHLVVARAVHHGGRTIVHGRPLAVTACSAASLLRP